MPRVEGKPNQPQMTGPSGGTGTNTSRHRHSKTFRHEQGNSPTGHGAPTPLGDDIRQKLQTYDRSPFMDVLLSFLEGSPSPDAIKAFAERNPDKWASAMASVARIAGYTEKTEINQSVHVTVSRMSDSQVEDRLKALQAQIGIDLLPQPIDANFEEVSSNVQTTAQVAEQDDQKGEQEASGEDL